MPIRRCAGDGQKLTGRPAAVYCTFFPEPNARRCYRAYVCEAHTSLIAALCEVEANALSADADSAGDTCPSCGQMGFDGFEVTYFDLYIPGIEPRKIELWMCPACGERIRPNYVKFGILMPDRDRETTESRGRVESVWAAFG